MTPDFSAFFSLYRPSAVLRVTGEDALAFLQGQFTQELRSPSTALSTYGLWLNQKGKVIADSFALRDGDVWWLVSYASSAQSIRERLEAYIIADDVLVEDVTHQWEGVAIAGAEATLWLEKRGVALPPRGEWAQLDGRMIFRGRRGGGDSWEWLCPAGAGLPQEVLESGIKEVDALALERWRIVQGVPSVPRDAGPGDLPNEAGLEEVAISYSKGCYLGQEVMARLKSMGQVRRRLLRVKGAGATPVCPAALYTEAKKVGEIRSAASEEDGNGFVGLAMLSLIGLDATRLLSLEAGGTPAVQVLEVPHV